LRVSQRQEKHSSTLYGTQRSATRGPAKEAETDISTTTTEEGWEMVAPSRGNGFTTGTLKRIDELRAQRQQTFEEYMEETAEWLDRADEKLDKYRSKSEAFRETKDQDRMEARKGPEMTALIEERRGEAQRRRMWFMQPMRKPSRHRKILACIVSMISVMGARVVEVENRNWVMRQTLTIW